VQCAGKEKHLYDSNEHSTGQARGIFAGFNQGVDFVNL
jgi:hypothetical protein